MSILCLMTFWNCSVSQGRAWVLHSLWPDILAAFCVICKLLIICIHLSKVFSADTWAFEYDSLIFSTSFDDEFWQHVSIRYLWHTVTYVLCQYLSINILVWCKSKFRRVRRLLTTSFLSPVVFVPWYVLPVIGFSWQHLSICMSFWYIDSEDRAV